MVGRGHLVQVLFHPMTWLTPTVILVWWLGIRLIRVLSPGHWSTSLHDHTFTLDFIGKVSTLTYLPLKPGYEDYPFLDQAGKDFEHGLYSILVLFCWHIQNGFILWCSWCHAIFSLFKIYTWLVLFLIILDYSLLLAANLINYAIRLGLYFYLYHR